MEIQGKLTILSYKIHVVVFIHLCFLHDSFVGIVVQSASDAILEKRSFMYYSGLTLTTDKNKIICFDKWEMKMWFGCWLKEDNDLCNVDKL